MHERAVVRRQCVDGDRERWLRRYVVVMAISGEGSDGSEGER